jgi:general secretion pathway protein N
VKHTLVEKTAPGFKSVRWAILGATIGLIWALVAYAPAQWLAAGIAHATEGQLLLKQPRGTVWDGTAELVLAGGEGSAGALSLPSRIHWTLAPTWLGIRVTLDAACCTDGDPLVAVVLAQADAKLEVQLTTQGVRLPAQVLAGLGAPWNTLQLAGTLKLQSQAIQAVWALQGKGGSESAGLVSLAGSAQLEAQSLQTALSTVRPLGSYRIGLAGPNITLSTLGADDALQLSGTGTLTGQPQFVGEAVAASGREAALANLLHIIGQRQPSSDGRMRTLLRLG